MSTSYRLQHKGTGTLLEQPFASATAAAIHQIETAPRSAGEYQVIPHGTLPCECGVEYVAQSPCCAIEMTRIDLDMGICSACREQVAPEYSCPKCGAIAD